MEFVLTRFQSGLFTFIPSNSIIAHTRYKINKINKQINELILSLERRDIFLRIMSRKLLFSQYFVSANYS